MSTSDHDEIMETSSTSRKRPLTSSTDHEDSESTKKKSNNFASADDSMSEETVNVKILVPAVIAGAIIGKNGETIGNIQKETDCRVKVSKTNDCFPHTNERIAMITGIPNAILKVFAFIGEKMNSKAISAVKNDPFDYKQTDRSKEVKIIIPSSTAGMVIGKGGEYIKSIKEIAGSFAQISAKDLVDPRLQERVVTLVGPDETALLAGARMVLAKLALDPSNGAPPYTNVSYLHVTSFLTSNGQHGGNSSSSSSGFRFSFDSSAARPLSPRNGSSSSFLSSSYLAPHRSYTPPPLNYTSFSSSALRYSPTASANNGLSSLFGGNSSSSATIGGTSAWLQHPPPTSGGAPTSLFATPIEVAGGGSSSSATIGGASSSSSLASLGNLQVLQFLDGLRSTLHSNGYNESAIVEITQAMQTLARYNVLGLGLGLGMAAISKSGMSDSEFGSGSASASLNPIAFGNKDSTNNPTSLLNYSASGGGSSNSQHRYVGFAGFDSPKTDNLSSGDSYIRRSGGASSDSRRDLSALLYPMGGATSDSSTGRHRRDSSSLGYVSRSNLRDGGESPLRSTKDYASALVKELAVDGNKVELLVPDSIIGAVLGKQGRNLGEIQRNSGARVEVSKRDPNNKNSGSDTTVQDRLVTIEGPSESVRAARRKVEDYINEEQYKREMRGNSGSNRKA